MAGCKFALLNAHGDPKNMQNIQSVRNSNHVTYGCLSVLLIGRNPVERNTKHRITFHKYTNIKVFYSSFQFLWACNFDSKLYSSSPSVSGGVALIPWLNVYPALPHAWHTLRKKLVLGKECLVQHRYM